MKVRLAIDHLTILRPKKRWSIYFVLVVEDITDPSRSIINVLPEYPIRMKPTSENEVYFEDNQDEDGLIIHEAEVNHGDTIKAVLYVRHSREKLRSVGQVIQEIASHMGAGSDFEAATGLVVTAAAATGLPAILAKIKDRDMGMITMSHTFKPDFEDQTEIDVRKETSTGEAAITYSWSIVE